jgi:epoxide hydrolase-like predicted phosphatase
LVLIKAVIFDFGRVITAQKPDSLFRDYEEMLNLAQDSINPIMFDSPAWQDALLGRKTAKDFWTSIGPALGLKSSHEIDMFRRQYHDDEAVNPGVLEIILRLHGRYKLAVLSNSPPGLKRWLSDWKILHLFDLVFCSGDEGVIKPDPIAFKITLERLNVRPEESVFIDDTQEHVDAARGLGINGIVFTSAESLGNDLTGLLNGNS